MGKSKYRKDMSIYEASDFWDEHDFGEFDDIEEVSGVQFLFFLIPLPFSFIHIPCGNNECLTAELSNENDR